MWFFSFRRTDIVLFDSTHTYGLLTRRYYKYFICEIHRTINYPLNSIWVTHLSRCPMKLGRPCSLKQENSVYQWRSCVWRYFDVYIYCSHLRTFSLITSCSCAAFIPTNSSKQHKFMFLQGLELHIADIEELCTSFPSTVVLLDHMAFCKPPLWEISDMRLSVN